MAQTAHKGHGNAAADTLRAAAGEKQRQELFKASEREKQRIMAETSAYRLQDSGAKWASGGGAAEAQLAQSTVGLVTKEEFARRRKEAEEAEEAAKHPPLESKEKEKEADKDKLKEKSNKKNKGKQRAATLSFAMEDDGEGEEVAVFKKPKKNPTVDFTPEVASDAAKEAAEVAGLVKPPPKKDAPDEITKLPAGYTCVRQTGQKQYEASLEVMASASAPRNRITGISSHTVTLLVRGAERAGEANAVLVSFLRSILGGNAITCDILRGHKAPVKTVRINGVESLDCLYHRLLMAHKFIK